jgi:hypothetical protein
MVKAIVPKGKHAGTHVGKVTVRNTGAFNLTEWRSRFERCQKGDRAFTGIRKAIALSQVSERRSHFPRTDKKTPTARGSVGLL